MKNDPTTHAPNAGEPSKTSEDSTPTMMRFMLKNPFKKIDILLWGPIVMLALGSILFYMSLRLFTESL